MKKPDRTSHHAKLLTVGDRQVLAFLSRDEEHKLSVMLQLWVAATDEPVRGQISLTSEENAQSFFDDLCDDTIGAVVEGLGLLEIISEYEEDE